LQEHAEVRFGVEVLAVAVGQREVQTSAGPAEQFVQVQRRIEHQLVGVSAGMVAAALGVAGQFVDVGDLQVDPGLVQAGAGAVPVAEEKLVG